MYPSIDPTQGKPSVIRPQNDTQTPAKSNKSSQINSLREQIKNGSYTVDFQKLASTLIQSGEMN